MFGDGDITRGVSGDTLRYQMFGYGDITRGHTEQSIFGKYCQVSVRLENVNVSFLENASVYLPALNSKIAIMFFLKVY